MALRAIKSNPVYKAFEKVIDLMTKEDLMIEPHHQGGFIVYLDTDSEIKYHVKDIEGGIVPDLPPFEEWKLIKTE